MNVYFRSGRKHSGSIPFPCLHNPLGAEPHKSTFHFSLHRGNKNVSIVTIRTWIFFFTGPHFLCLFVLSPYWILWLDLYAVRKENFLMLSFLLSSHVHVWSCNTRFVWGSTLSAVHRHARRPVQTTQLPFAAIPQNSFHADSAKHPPHTPWSPEIVQLIKSACFSTFPKTFFAFQERREAFPWNLRSAPSDLARSRRSAATPAPLLSSFWQ